MDQPGADPLPPPQPVGSVGAPETPAPAPRPAPGPAPWPEREHRVGDLTATWRILLALAWAAAFFAYAAVWQVSVQIGIGTWWIGPRADPARMVLRLTPFVVCLVMVLLVVYGVRNLPRIGMALGAGLAVFALPDLGRSVGLALTELLIAVALIATSAASTTGRYRHAEVPGPAGSDPGSDGSVPEPVGGSAPTDDR